MAELYEFSNRAPNELVLHDETALDQARLNESESDLIRRKSWYALAIGGAIFLVLLGLYFVITAFFHDKTLEQQVATLTKEVARQETTNSALVENISRANNENNALSKQNQELVAENASLQNTNENLSQAVKEKSVLEQQIEQLKAQKATSDPGKTVVNYNLFSTTTVDGVEVVTGMNFESSDSKAPASQYCYITTPIPGQVSRQHFSFGGKASGESYPTYLPTEMATAEGYSAAQYERFKQACNWM